VYLHILKKWYILDIMKKYKFGLLALLFVLGLFIFNTNSAKALVPGCSSTAGYSSVTGASCAVSTSVVAPEPEPETFSVCSNGVNTVTGFICGCTSRTGYSSVNGRSCTGCDSTSGYNLLTGASCAPVPTMPPIPVCTNGYDATTGFICGCSSTSGYSATTGASCNPTTTPPYYQSPVISGVSGPQYLDVNEKGTWTVKAYDKNGRDLSYSVIWGDEGNQYTNGMYGVRPTYEQSATFTHSYSKAGTYKITFTVTSENTIRCITTPCPSNGQTAQVSLSVRVGNGETPPTSSITVLSPNGGETWVKGTTQKIKWDDVSNVKYDIKLTSYYTPCTSNICPMVYHMPYTIASDVYGNSSDGHSYFYWIVGSGPGFDTVPDGSYTIQVCQSGTDNCDSSDSYFKIVKGLPIITPPSFDCKNGYDVNTGFRCGCTSAQGYSAHDGKSCRLENLPPGCTSVYGYSSTTGELCSGKAIPIPMPNPTPTTTCTITSILRLGSTGADVSCLQSRIGLISDGKFGPRTLIAVKAFQANAGLKADGVVGPKSISALEVAN
jgi:hypothetical protein